MPESLEIFEPRRLKLKIDKRLKFIFLGVFVLFILLILYFWVISKKPTQQTIVQQNLNEITKAENELIQKDFETRYKSNPIYANFDGIRHFDESGNITSYEAYFESAQVIDSSKINLTLNAKATNETLILQVELPEFDFLTYKLNSANIEIKNEFDVKVYPISEINTFAKVGNSVIFSPGSKLVISK